jgi:hypothetical protein
MMDFSTLFCKSSLPDRFWRLLLACVLIFPATLSHAQSTAEISQLRIERSEEEVQLSAQLHFELPAVVEDALLKGIPMVFVMGADTLRERWYWYDKKITSSERYMRLAYQPLTRRWRLNVSSGPGAAAAVGLALNQSYDSLAQALAAIKRVTKWKIADAGEFDPAVRYRAEFRFKLDLTQLPRPFQIGALGQTEWDIAVSTVIPFSLENVK